MLDHLLILHEKIILKKNIVREWKENLLQKLAFKTKILDNKGKESKKYALHFHVAHLILEMRYSMRQETNTNCNKILFYKRMYSLKML